MLAPARIPVAAGKKMANTEKNVSSSLKSGPTHTHTHTRKYILFTYRDILPKHTMTYTLTTPLIRRRSHIKTHAYQAPHPCRCSGACLASFPLSLHPSLASNPSLRCLPSVDQRCKTLPPAPKLSLQPSIPASLLSN